MDLNKLSKNILCIIIGILISLMQLQFFDVDSIFSIAFLIILIITVPTIYLYFLPKHDTIILFIYTIILTFILDYFNRDISIRLLLLTLFSIILLFTQSRFTENAILSKEKKPDYFKYIIILIILFMIVSFISIYIFEEIIKPNVNEDNEIEFLKETIYEEDDVEEEIEDDVESSSGSGISSEEDSLDLIFIIKILMAIFISIFIFYVFYRIIKHLIWRRKMINSNNKKQTRMIYKYFLNSLMVIDIGKKDGETPYEYLNNVRSIDFPFDIANFERLTNAFIKSNYGDIIVDDSDQKLILEYYYSISKSLIRYLGIKDYIFKYIPKNKGTK